jgi:hypothetical protein
VNRELVLTLSDYEANDPEKSDYLEFDASLTARGFAGLTTFWTSRTDIDCLIEELTRLDRTLACEVAFRAGWGAEANVILHIGPFGQSGRLLVCADLAADGPSEGHRSRVHAEFVVLPNTLTEFRRRLEALVRSRSQGECRLAGDPEAGV